MSLESDMVSFLKTNAEIKKLNFQFMTHKIYPAGYSTDVANLIDKELIDIDRKIIWSGASYFYDTNRLAVEWGFDIKNDYFQSLFIHECTHALLDYKNLGLLPGFEHEAVAYLAEALWREAKGLPSLAGGAAAIRTECHRIAATILKGTYIVQPADITALLNAVKSVPHYAKKTDYSYLSDGV